MRKALCFIFLIFQLFINADGQIQAVNNIDKLKKSLQKASGQDRIELLNAIAWEYRKTKPDSTILYCDKVISTSIEIESRSEIGKALNYKGLAYFYKTRYVKSFETFSEALNFCSRNEDSTQYAHALNNLGRLYLVQGDFIKSYDYLFNALSFFKYVNDSLGIAYSLKGLSEMYQTQKNYTKALEMTQRTIDIRRLKEDTSSLISSIEEHASIYGEIGDINKALEIYAEGEQLAKKINDKINLAQIKISIAKLYFKEGNFRKSQIEAESAYDLAKNSGNQHLITSISLELGKIHFKNDEYNRARQILTAILSNTTLSVGHIAKQEAYFYLSEVYDKLGNKEKAYEHFIAYLNALEQFESIESSRKIQRAESRLEIEKRDRVKELLKVKKATDQTLIERQKSNNLVLGIILAIVMVGVIILFITERRRKFKTGELEKLNLKIKVLTKEIEQKTSDTLEKNDQLTNSNQELEKINYEKDLLMNIVAHDLKSPLNTLSTLCDLLKMDHLNQDQLEWIGRIELMVDNGLKLIQDLLDANRKEEEDLQVSFTKVDINDMVLQKIQDFKNEAEAKSISVSFESKASDLIIESDQASISRVLDNLISNALKFSDAGSIVQLFTTHEDDSAIIKVKDFGQGFSPHDKQRAFKKFAKLSASPTNGESSNGLGLAIVKMLIHKLDGSIDLISEQGFGSEFVIRIPSVKKRELLVN